MVIRRNILLNLLNKSLCGLFCHFIIRELLGLDTY